MTSKADLRSELRRRRADYVAAERAGGGLLVPTLMIAEYAARHLPASGTIAAYVAQGDEVDPTPLLFQAIDRGLTIALPWVATRAEPMRFHHWFPGDELVPGPFGLLQPRTDTAELVPDVVFTPLVGFDRRGHRLGQGAGYYDRALARLPNARAIGLAWAVQEVDALPFEPWDVPLYGIATECEWIGA
ncbi:5-formyltetrahydrofolate cyclo-ligase [Sphingomonas naphthae]|uniref:5-formyltetrahydrofolate cyclo-ligase n=1 Tax=Sphingomonas naphthae TaxID=1813468 RepID=A0ABY7THS4_9SPHN|nr:5-formyltetrahydrofolate cyclo-ligase [Sphingomonas naphthae]WCT71980.1 5-formyltetrahydrofolate cyclo-ligase [Sphingomonas naphthae]